MALNPLLRWGAFLSVVAAVAVAVALRLQQPLVDSSGATSTSDSVTHCYERVRTHDSDNPVAQCFTVTDGLFSRVWTRHTDEPEELSRHTDAGYVLPGLWDGHGHLLGYGQFLHSVDLFGSRSLEDVRARIKKYIRSNPGAGTEKQWVRGVGWDQAAFGRMPTAADIEQDPELKGIYMMVERIDVHCSWVSQAVLDLLPTDLPEVVPGGEIVRDPGLGVFCDNALELLTEVLPEPSREDKARAVKTAMASLNQAGLVGVHDAGAPPGDQHMFADLAEHDDAWTLRVYSMMECDQRNTFCPDDGVRVVREDGRLLAKSIKLFADGALGSWGSAMIEPYTDHPWTSGSLLINASALTSVTKSWVAEGYQVNIHAIGDLANRNAIDAFEAALKEQCPEPNADLAECQARHRFRIEHSQIIHPDDQKRMHDLGIIPSIQPTHATSDMLYAQDRLGPQRTRDEAYRMKSLLDIKPILGSDFPVEPPNPFEGIYAAVTRKNPHTGRGKDGDNEGWHVEEALNLDEALNGFTLGPAHGAFLDGKAGVIKEAAFADWIVLDEPIEDTDIEDLRNIKVRETWVAGRRVYRRED